MIRSLNCMNYAYIFSLLPHILVLPNKILPNTSCDHVSAHLMFTLTYIKASLKLTSHLKGHE